jgi:hypothetical protein
MPAPQSAFQKQIARARRIATRTRSVMACLPCKIKKTKCSDLRPCSRCKATNPAQCLDEDVDVASSQTTNSGITQVETIVLPHLESIDNDLYLWSQGVGILTDFIDPFKERNQNQYDKKQQNQ